MRQFFILCLFSCFTGNVFAGDCYTFTAVVEKSLVGSLKVRMNSGFRTTFKFNDLTYGPNLPVGTHISGTVYGQDGAWTMAKESFDIPSRSVASLRLSLKKNGTKDLSKCLKLHSN